MFYCNECRKKNDWPESMFRSYGRCEVCGKVGSCFDVASKLIPWSELDRAYRVACHEEDCGKVGQNDKDKERRSGNKTPRNPRRVCEG